MKFDRLCKVTMDTVQHDFKGVKDYTYEYKEVPDSADGAV